MNLGNLTASITLNVSNFVSGIQQAMSQLSHLGNSVNNNLGNQTQQAANKARSSVSSLGGSFKDLDRIVGGILVSQAFYGVVSDIKEATSAVANFSMNMEQAKISMEYFVGSAKNAQAFIVSMQDFASTTSYNTEQAIALSRRLMGAGFQPEQVRGVMTILNDANAATGGTADELSRIVLALTQIQTKGKLAGQEVMQLANAGIPIYQILQQQLGLSADQMGNLGKLSVGADAAVKAVLQGLEKRYKGAAERLAETMKGMIQTIKDDALMVSEQLFEGPYQAIEGFVRKVRNTMNEARKAIFEHGVGGLFEHFVPPELQNSVRSIVAALQSLAGSFGILWRALEPIAEQLGSVLIKTLGAVLPVVAEAVRIVAMLAAGMIQANPAVRLFVGAVMGLLVASVAAKALMFLWSITRMGVICTAIAEAVMTLVRAIQWLFVALAKNPITALIMLVAGALLYLAMSSKTATAWLDGLTSKLAQLTGMDISGILKPTNNDSLQSQIDQYNKSLGGMGDNLTGVGEQAKKAGKKVKDSFIASFDEVFQIPEKLNQLGAGLGSGAGMGNMKMPNFPSLDVTPPKSPGNDGQNPNIPSLPIGIPGRGNGGDGGSGGGPFDFPPPNFAVVTEALATIESKIAELRQKLAEAQGALSGWVTQTAGAISGWALQTAGAISSWVTQTAGAFGGWVVQTAEAIRTWITDTGTAIGNWATQTATSFGTWTVGVATSLADWATQAGQSIADWTGSTAAQVATWVLNTGTALTVWTVQTAQSVSSWVISTSAQITAWTTNTAADLSTWTTDTAAQISSWVTNTSASVSSWVTDTAASVATWATGTAARVTSWTVSTGAQITAWVTTTAANFTTWSTGVISNLEAWAKSTEATVNSWVNNTGTNLYNWGVNTGGNLASWVNAAIDNLNFWSVNGSSIVAGWVNSTSADVAQWVDNVLANMAIFANTGMAAIATWANSTYGTFRSWLSNTASAVGDWANSTLNTIVSWAQNAWSTITGLAQAAGHDIGSAFNAAGSTVASGATHFADWYADNKSWTVPVTAGLIAVGAAAAIIGTGGAAAPVLAPMLALETGGIVDKEQFVRIGEKNRREAVIPLQNDQYMKPFSAAVAQDLMQMIGGQGGGGQGSDQRPILYVGTLIASDQSLKELNRRMEVIQIQEQQRKGLA